MLSLFLSLDCFGNAGCEELVGLIETGAFANLERLEAHQSLRGAGGRALHHTERERRFLKQPQRVVHIDSIYRGRA